MPSSCFPSLLLADVIYLKNGQKIVAQVTKEDEKQVYYEADGGEFAIAKSMVDHVEKSDSPAAASPAPSRPNRDVPLPLTPPVDSSIEEGSAVIHDDAVDEAYLTQLDGRRHPQSHTRRTFTSSSRASRQRRFF